MELNEQVINRCKLPLFVTFPILKTTITVERLQQRGYESMFVYYQKIAPFLNDPLYT